MRARLSAWADVRNFSALQRVAESPDADALHSAASSDKREGALVGIRCKIGEVNGAPIAAVVKRPRKVASGGIEAGIETALPRNGVVREANGGTRPSLWVRGRGCIGQHVPYLLALALGAWAGAKAEPLHKCFVLQLGMHVWPDGHQGLYAAVFRLARTNKHAIAAIEHGGAEQRLNCAHYVSD